MQLLQHVLLNQVLASSHLKDSRQVPAGSNRFQQVRFNMVPMLDCPLSFQLQTAQCWQVFFFFLNAMSTKKLVCLNIWFSDKADPMQCQRICLPPRPLARSQINMPETSIFDTCPIRFYREHTDVEFQSVCFKLCICSLRGLPWLAHFQSLLSGWSA